MQEFNIRGIPKAQARPRKGKGGHFYDPSKVYKDNITAQLLLQNPHYIAEGGITVNLLFNLPRPKSLKKSVINHVKKPDIDNLVKSVLDAAKGIVWRDDSQIVILHAMKRYTAVEPGINMTVNEVGE